MKVRKSRRGARNHGYFHSHSVDEETAARSVLPIGWVDWPRRTHHERCSSEISDLAGALPSSVIETNPKLLRLKIAGAEQAAILRFKELENSSDHHEEVIALTDALIALKILGESDWAG
jgi:hypothetical protein